jgi:hypothetical protein
MVMKKTIAVLTFLFPLSMQAQTVKPPAFNPQSVVVAVPAYLPGIMPDSSALLRNDTLFYTLVGQTFGKGIPLKPGPRYPSRKDPWQVMGELASAYAKSDPNAIRDLYDAKSRPRVDSLLNSADAEPFLKSVRKATGSDLRLLGGFDYHDGFLAFSRDTALGMHLNYIVREGDRHSLSALNDPAPTSWNLGMFYKYMPGPRIDLDGLALPDSLKFRDTLIIRADLKERNRWVVVCPRTPNTQILFQAQDNGMNDRDPAVGRVEMAIGTRRFMAPGEHVIHVVSLTHPVDRVSETFLKGRAYRILLKR